MNRIEYMKISSLLHTNQWPKNLLILVPAFFAALEWNGVLFVNLLLGMISFSFLASAVYVINDRIDANSDRHHPVKKHRVSAAEHLSNNRIIAAALGLLVVAFGGFSLLGQETCGYAGMYLLINVLYNLWLKQIAFVDVLLMTSGYWLRLLVGGAIAAVPLSWWLVAIITLIALLLLLFKRRSDVFLYHGSGVVLRKTIPVYAKLPLEMALRSVAVIILTLYGSYLVHVMVEENRSPVVLLTMGPAVTGMYRFFHLAKKSPHKDALQLIFTDGGMWVLGMTWFSLLVMTIYIDV